jgi:hypothetical protein
MEMLSVNMFTHFHTMNKRTWQMYWLILLVYLVFKNMRKNILLCIESLSQIFGTGSYKQS